MRVMQLIDSLELGGAERMAVSYANMLSHEIERSYLCVTRKEGALKKTLSNNVSYCFVNKTKTLDFKAVRRAIAFIKKENISLIHAHGTSFLFAYLIKRKYKDVRVIWHNHHGASTQYGLVKTTVIKKCISSFDGVISVNKDIQKWVNQRLGVPQKKSHYVSNFVAIQDKEPQTLKELSGSPSKRIVCLANLKNPKEHLFLCKAFYKVIQKYPGATLHLVGKDFKDDYSNHLKEFIKDNGLKNAIFIHGQQDNPQKFLAASTIGVIASSSEGLPMALLEYGAARLAVISTDVGQCAQVVQDNGLIVPSGDISKMSWALEQLISEDTKRDRLAKLFHMQVKTFYSQDVIRNKVLELYSHVCLK